MSKRKHKNKSNQWSNMAHWNTKDPKFAFRLGGNGREVWGGPIKEMEQRLWAMLLVCNGDTPRPNVIASPLAKSLMPKLAIPSPVPYVSINWPDMSTPEVSAEFWDSLTEGLKKLGKPGPIGVCCFGGTGRTGTALAILAQLSGAVPPGQCPLKFVRDCYYSDAVESNGQGKYIEAVTGVPVTTPVHAPLLPSATAARGGTAAWNNGVYTEHYGEGKDYYGSGADLHCIHGKPMDKFCYQCMKGSGISNYKREADESTTSASALTVKLPETKGNT